MKYVKSLLTIFLAALSLQAGAQSQSFKLGQWTEINNAIIKNLARHYVDTLRVDDMFRGSINAMLESLDPYTVYVPESEEEGFELAISNSYGGIGAIIFKPSEAANVIINEPYEGSPAAKAGLQCGDEILEIDGASVVGMDATKASSLMKGKPGTVVKFSVLKVRSGKIVEMQIEREKIHLPDIEYYGILDDGVTGYICQSSFTSGVSSKIAQAMKELKLKGMKRLVLDLRGNGGGLLDEAVKIVGLFVPKGTLVVTSKGSDGIMEYRTPAEPVDTRIPLMIMVDSSSASASEIVAGGIQDLDRGVVAGHRTFGKGLVQRVLPLPYNGQLKITVAKYYTPSGRCVQARDYSRRAEDGSVGEIPDSLTKEFKTLVKKRTVRDGGGITPDIAVEAPSYGRICYSAVMSGITNNYPIEFARTHESIAPTQQFHLGDADFEAFLDWAQNQKMDSRSEARTYYDMMVKQLKKDGEYDEASEQLEALGKLLKRSQREALASVKDKLVPILEEEIVSRYYFQKAAVQMRLRYDTQLKNALSQWK